MRCPRVVLLGVLAMWSLSGCFGSPSDESAGQSAPVGNARPEAVANDSAEVRLIREQAHVVLLELCGSCHTDDSEEANPGALTIFNLHDPDWHTRFDVPRLQSAKGRIDVQGSDDDKRVFERFVAQEIAVRTQPGHAGP